MPLYLGGKVGYRGGGKEGGQAAIMISPRLRVILHYVSSEFII